MECFHIELLSDSTCTCTALSEMEGESHRCSPTRSCSYPTPATSFLILFRSFPLVLVIPPSSPPSLPPPPPPRHLPALALRNRIVISINTIGIVDRAAAARALPSHRCSKDSIPARCPMWVEFVVKAYVVPLKILQFNLILILMVLYP